MGNLTSGVAHVAAWFGLSEPLTGQCAAWAAGAGWLRGHKCDACPKVFPIYTYRLTPTVGAWQS